MRLKILNDHGGFYLDSDLELLKPIDEFCACDFVTGFIDRPPNVFLNMCFLGAAKGNGRIAEMLRELSEGGFVDSDPGINPETGEESRVSKCVMG